MPSQRLRVPGTGLVGAAEARTFGSPKAGVQATDGPVSSGRGSSIPSKQQRPTEQLPIPKLDNLGERVRAALGYLQELIVVHESKNRADGPSEREIVDRLRAVAETVTAAFESNNELCEGWVRLAAALDAAQTADEAERRLLAEQQDAVLESLLDEHERQVLTLEHESRAQLQQIAVLQEERAEQQRIIESLKNSGSRAPRAPTPRTWPPAVDLDELRVVGNGGDPGASDTRATIARLVADRDHLREGLRRLKAQRDEAQQETLGALEQLQTARAELEELRALLPSVTAPPACPSTPPRCASPPALPALAFDKISNGSAAITHGDCRLPRSDPARGSSTLPGLADPAGAEPQPVAGQRHAANPDPDWTGTGGKHGLGLAEDTRAPSSKSSLKRKPDPAVNTLGSYSLTRSSEPETFILPVPNKVPPSGRHRP